MLAPPARLIFANAVCADILAAQNLVRFFRAARGTFTGKMPRTLYEKRLNMQWYDVVMICVLVGATVFGAIKGIAWQIASLASIVLSYFVSFAFSDPLAESGLFGVNPPGTVTWHAGDLPGNVAFGLGRFSRRSWCNRPRQTEGVDRQVGAFLERPRECCSAWRSHSSPSRSRRRSATTF